MQFLLQFKYFFRVFLTVKKIAILSLMLTRENENIENYSCMVKLRQLIEKILSWRTEEKSLIF